jgi:FXSXX-COOH protein
MDARGNDEIFALIDLRGIPLDELQRRDDSPFVHCLRRITAENDDPDALTVVAFDSAVA